MVISQEKFQTKADIQRFLQMLSNLTSQKLIGFHLLKISAKSETKVMKENPRKRLRVPPNSATRVVHV